MDRALSWVSSDPVRNGADLLCAPCGHFPPCLHTREAGLRTNVRANPAFAFEMALPRPSDQPSKNTKGIVGNTLRQVL